jgi:hypothetical protein
MGSPIWVLDPLQYVWCHFTTYLPPCPSGADAVLRLKNGKTKIYITRHAIYLLSKVDRRFRLCKYVYWAVHPEIEIASKQCEALNRAWTEMSRLSSRFAVLGLRSGQLYTTLHCSVFQHSCRSMATLTNAETRCRHCFITFATPGELANHAAKYCFPGAPELVLEQFPIGSIVTDTVSNTTGYVVGSASNPLQAHSCVAILCPSSQITSDVRISRIRLVHNE